MREKGVKRLESDRRQTTCPIRARSDLKNVTAERESTEIIARINNEQRKIG